MESPKNRILRLLSWFRRPESDNNSTAEIIVNPQANRARRTLVERRPGRDHSERPRLDPMLRDRIQVETVDKPIEPAEKVTRAPSEPTNGHHPVSDSHAADLSHDHDQHGHDLDHSHDHAAVPAPEDHGHGSGHHDIAHGHEDHGHGGHAHHVMVAKGTGGRLELHGNTLHLTKGGLFGFFMTLLGIHGGHAHQTIRVSDISAIEFEKHGLFFHYVRFCYPGAPMESGNPLHDMMADNALLMSLFDNRDLYHLKEQLEQSMEIKALAHG